jgi:hypothetical protein
MALTRSQRIAIIAFAAKETENNDSYHSMPHLRQTARIAVRLARAEKADVDICWTAAMLHDIRKAYPGDHGSLGADEASRFLSALGAGSSFIGTVCDAILFHNKDFDGGPIERRILWDADKLQIMSPYGFRKRMMPYWEMKRGKTAGLEISIKEYYLYAGRFHTDSGRGLVEKARPKMELLIKKLESVRDKPLR